MKFKHLRRWLIMFKAVRTDGVPVIVHTAAMGKSWKASVRWVRNVYPYVYPYERMGRIQCHALYSQRPLKPHLAVLPKPKRRP